MLILDSVLRIQFIQVDVELLKYKYLHVQIFDIDKGDDYSIYYLCVILALFLQRSVHMMYSTLLLSNSIEFFITYQNLKC